MDGESSHAAVFAWLHIRPEKLHIRPEKRTQSGRFVCDCHPVPENTRKGLKAMTATTDTAA
ncbi:hypothetical protein [Planotetraspora mira]|uniref:Uncharacterized protein n=1 Tax=Planotetraspora mira TaxID=58121 RepID=A0A8J3X9J5_9ACTN|nr:hypothetical protein [Planotetraspora mira]GII31939.1 hypothetical protein Pmi06nite_53810 [Planotetraspora mira]